MDSRKKILIARTKNTPEVSLTAGGRLLLSGRSIHEEPYRFFNRLFEWIYHYCQHPNHTFLTIDISLEYCNSGSTKAILDLLKAVAGCCQKGFPININWYYEKDDDDVLDHADVYESITGLKFNFIELENLSTQPISCAQQG